MKTYYLSTNKRLNACLKNVSYRKHIFSKSSCFLTNFVLHLVRAIFAILVNKSLIVPVHRYMDSFYHQNFGWRKNSLLYAIVSFRCTQKSSHWWSLLLYQPDIHYNVCDIYVRQINSFVQLK